MAHCFIANHHVDTMAHRQATGHRSRVMMCACSPVSGQVVENGFNITCMLIYSVDQFSEDALVIWVASRIIAGHYGSWQQNITVLLIVYTGIVVSDMVCMSQSDCMSSAKPWR